MWETTFIAFKILIPNSWTNYHSHVITKTTYLAYRNGVGMKRPYSNTTAFLNHFLDLFFKFSLLILDNFCSLTPFTSTTISTSQPNYVHPQTPCPIIIHPFHQGLSSYDIQYYLYAYCIQRSNVALSCSKPNAK